jgi:hemerythrin-like domain-containing protein
MNLQNSQNLQNLQNEESPNEDLMREHGVLNRILLIYEEIINRLSNNQFHLINPKFMLAPAYLIRKFVEDHHEITEEKYIFPVLLKKNIQTNIVHELINQHKIGRLITDNIINSIRNNNVEEIIKNMKLFIKMYRMHESREDTVVFQEFKKVIDKKEYEELGEIFEKEEEKKFGKNGYEKILNIVIHIEKYFNIFDLTNTTVNVVNALHL